MSRRPEVWTPPTATAEPVLSDERPPNRAERRQMRNSLRAYRRAAARARDRAMSVRKQGTPAVAITTAIRKRGLARRWFEGEKWLVLPRTRRRRRAIERADREEMRRAEAHAWARQQKETQAS